MKEHDRRSAAVTLAVACFLGAGCVPVERYRVETDIHEDGSVERAVFR